MCVVLFHFSAIIGELHEDFTFVRKIFTLSITSGTRQTIVGIGIDQTLDITNMSSFIMLTSWVRLAMGHYSSVGSFIRLRTVLSRIHVNVKGAEGEFVLVISSFLGLLRLRIYYLACFSKPLQFPCVFCFAIF